MGITMDMDMDMRMKTKPMLFSILTKVILQETLFSHKEFFNN